MLTQTHSLLEVFLCTALVHTCILSKCTLHFTKDDKKKKKKKLKLSSGLIGKTKIVCRRTLLKLFSLPLAVIDNVLFFIPGRNVEASLH